MLEAWKRHSPSCWPLFERFCNVGLRLRLFDSFVQKLFPSIAFWKKLHVKGWKEHSGKLDAKIPKVGKEISPPHFRCQTLILFFYIRFAPCCSVATFSVQLFQHLFQFEGVDWPTILVKQFERKPHQRALIELQNSRHTKRIPQSRFPPIFVHDHKRSLGKLWLFEFKVSAKFCKIYFSLPSTSMLRNTFAIYRSLIQIYSMPKQTFVIGTWRWPTHGCCPLGNPPCHWSNHSRYPIRTIVRLIAG